MAKYRDLSPLHQVVADNFLLMALMLTDVNSDLRRDAWRAARAINVSVDKVRERQRLREEIPPDVELGGFGDINLAEPVTEDVIVQFLVRLGQGKKLMPPNLKPRDQARGAR